MSHQYAFAQQNELVANHITTSLRESTEVTERLTIMKKWFVWTLKFLLLQGFVKFRFLVVLHWTEKLKMERYGGIFWSICSFRAEMVSWNLDDTAKASAT